MSGNQSLKNRFQALESKLSDNQEMKDEMRAKPESQFPEIHVRVKNNPSNEESLGKYLSDMKNSFERIHIREMSDNGLAFENELSTLIHGFTKKPCLIQLIHPMDKKGLENFKLLILALNESGSHWRTLFKSLSWVGVSFATSATVITFSQQSIDVNKLEGLLKMISLRSNHVSSFHLQKNKTQVAIELRLETYVNKKISSERDAVL